MNTYRITDGQGASTFITLDTEPKAGDVLPTDVWGQVTVDSVTPVEASTYEADVTVHRG